MPSQHEREFVYYIKISRQFLPQYNQVSSWFQHFQIDYFLTFLIADILTVFRIIHLSLDFFIVFISPVSRSYLSSSNINSSLRDCAVSYPRPRNLLQEKKNNSRDHATLVLHSAF